LKTNIENQDAGAQMDSFIIVMALFIIGIMIVAFTTDAVYVGVGEGDRAPELEGRIYNPVSGTWSQFDLREQFDETWQEGDNGTWYLVEFMDINCGACKSAAPKMKSIHEQFSSPSSGRQPVEVIAVSIKLRPGDWPYPETGIEDFASDYGHQFRYLSDWDTEENREVWEIVGTPTYFIIKPNGVISWASPEHRQEGVDEAVARIIPEAN